MSTLPTEDFFEDTFQRCPHDKKNPYSLVNNDLIRDQSISPECRWLIIFLLSNDDYFRITVKQVISHLSPNTPNSKRFYGRDSVYKIINEAIEAGYIKREFFKKKNKNGRGFLKRSCYFVSEKPKFKKCLPHTDLQDTDHQDPVQPDNKEITREEIPRYKELPPKPPTQQRALDAPEVVVSDSSKKKKTIFSASQDTTKHTKLEVHPCLQRVDIPEVDKQQLSKHFSQEHVSKAVDFCTQPDFKPSKTLSKAIWYYSQNPDHAVKAESEEQRELRQREESHEKIQNRKWAFETAQMKEFKQWREGHIPERKINAFATSLQISGYRFFDYSASIEYDHPRFCELVSEAWIKIGLPTSGPIFDCVKEFLFLGDLSHSRV